MRDKPTERYIHAWLSRTSALPQKAHRFPRAPAPHPGPLPAGEREKWGASRRQATGDAQRASALSPQRFGRVAPRLEAPLGYPPMEIRWDAPRAFMLGFNTMLAALKAISLGYFSLLRASCPTPFGPASPFACAPAHAWASKRKVTRAAAADRNARRAGGPVAVSQQPKTGETG